MLDLIHGDPLRQELTSATAIWDRPAPMYLYNAADFAMMLWLMLLAIDSKQKIFIELPGVETHTHTKQLLAALPISCQMLYK